MLPWHLPYPLDFLTKESASLAGLCSAIGTPFAGLCVVIRRLPYNQCGWCGSRGHTRKKARPRMYSPAETVVHHLSGHVIGHRAAIFVLTGGLDECSDDYAEDQGIHRTVGDFRPVNKRWWRKTSVMSKQEGSLHATST